MLEFIILVKFKLEMIVRSIKKNKMLDLTNKVFLKY